MVLRHFITFILLYFTLQINSQNTYSKQVVRFNIEAPQLETTKRIWLYLPKNYQTSGKAYPVIYMHDAQNLFDEHTAFANEWKIDEFLDTLKTQESIIVGIEHGNEKRIEELTPFTHETHGGGGGDAYLNFIVETLKPAIDDRYHTLKHPEHTTIFGSSLGGLMALYGIITYSEIFGKAGIFSPALWINPDIYDVIKQSTIPKHVRLYIMAGNNESETMVANVEKLSTLLLEKGIDETQLQVKIVEGGEHNEIFWSKEFKDAYFWLYK